MSDNDSDNDEQGGINLTGFLFGNIDEKGELENDFLDDEAKKHLSSLHRFGIGSILSGVMNDEDQGEVDSDANSSSSGDERINKQDDNPDRYDDTDFTKKEESAVDYSDINELADESPPGSERQVTEQSEKDLKEKKDEDFEMDLEDAIPASKLVGDRLNSAEASNASNNVARSSEEGGTTKDKELMPPPPPLRLQ